MKQSKRPVLKNKQSPLKKTRPNSYNSFSSIDTEDRLTVDYDGGVGSGSTVTETTTTGGSVTPSVDPDFVSPTKIDPIISEVFILPGSGIITNPEIKTPSDSPIVPIGDPVSYPEPTAGGLTPTDPIKETLTPTVDNGAKKVWSWVLLAVIAAAVIYFLARKK